MKNDKLYHDYSMWKGAHPEIFRRAENLRNNPTEAEKKFWEVLQLDPYKKFHFRRQHPIHHFIVDFYFHKLNLIIEVDGEYHETADQQKKDQLRSDLLEFQKLEIIRFSNQEVLQQIDSVLIRLDEKIKR